MLRKVSPDLFIVQLVLDVQGFVLFEIGFGAMEEGGVGQRLAV